MTLSEKSAYLKGLMDGLKLDTEKDEGKMIAAIVDMLSDVAETVSDLEDVVDTISDELDEDEDDAEDDEYDFGDDEVLYEVKCPTCGEEITIDEQMLDEGSTVCPNCGEELEFDLEEDEEEPKE